MSELVPGYLDVTKLALDGFLARYRDPTLTAYRTDLRCYWRWCAETGADPLRITRAQLELYIRELESRGYAPATTGQRQAGSTFVGASRQPNSNVVRMADAASVTRAVTTAIGRRSISHIPLMSASMPTMARAAMIAMVAASRAKSPGR